MKAILVTSSDFTRVVEYRNKLRISHEENIEFLNSVKPLATRRKRIVSQNKEYYFKCFGKLIRIPQDKVKNYEQKDLIVKYV